jgi:hypothetical protein
MIKVHLVRLELAAAIGTGDAPEVPQQFDHPRLPDADPLQFEVSIPPVVLDVIGSLAWSNGHDPV